MTAPRSANEQAPTVEQLRLEGGKVRPMNQGEREAVWRRVERQAETSSNVVTWPLLAAACVVAGLFALIMIRGVHAPTPTSGVHAVATSVARQSDAPGAATSAVQTLAGARTVSLQGRGQLVLRAQTVASLPSSLGTSSRGAVRVRLDRGRIDATVSPRAADEPFSIVTPQVSVTVVGTGFSVTVDGAVTTVVVDHGTVRVENTDGVVLVNAGESVRSDDARLTPRRPFAVASPRVPEASESSPPRQRRSVPATDTTVTSPEPCKESEPLAQHACLSRAARAGGLGGENALLALGLLERDKLGDHDAALSVFRQYERRYPRGALAPEVAISLATMLSSDGATDPACATAADYARRFPDDRVTLGRLAAFCRK